MTGFTHVQRIDGKSAGSLYQGENGQFRFVFDNPDTPLNDQMAMVVPISKAIARHQKVDVQQVFTGNDIKLQDIMTES